MFHCIAVVFYVCSTYLNIYLCLFYIYIYIFMSVLHIYIYIYVCSTYIWNVYFYWKNKQVHRSGALTQYSTYSWVLSSLILKYLENVRYLNIDTKYFTVQLYIILFPYKNFIIYSTMHYVCSMHANMYYVVSISCLNY